VLYEIPERELTPERALAELREVERRLLFLEGGSPRPILAVPHLLAGDSSAYYHGYVLAEMAVQQTRAFYRDRDGHLVDNSAIGPELARTWWQPGNSVRFAEFIERLTKKPLSANDYAQRVNRGVEEAQRDARRAIERMSGVPEFAGEVALDATIRVMHGNATVSVLERDFAVFSERFASWIDAATSAERS
jgi:hypothetical protein